MHSGVFGQGKAIGEEIKSIGGGGGEIWVWGGTLANFA